MYSYSKFEHNYTKSKFKYEPALSPEYRVFINGKELPVYACRISAYSFNRVWPGFQRPVDQTVIASYVNIVSDEELQLEVICTHSSEKIAIKPISAGLRHTVTNGKICFTLKDNGQYVLECGGHHHCLYIFNSKPIATPKEDEVTHFFGPGVHFPGKITLSSNESVYVDKDALVFGCIYAENAKNIHIFGNGILDDSHEERTGNYCYENYTNGNMKFYDCSDIKIEGIGMTNSAIWCLNLFHCENVHANDIKIFGQWRYNTDGIDIVNSRDIFIDNSFVHSFDDTITIKGIDRYCHADNENIHVKNCLLWCDWGKCCEIGIETNCRKYADISFTGCDILAGGHVALDISNGYSADISNITFENINVEYNFFDTEPQMQDTDDMKYSKHNTHHIPTLLQIRNSSWLTQDTLDAWGITLPDPLDMTELTPHMIHGVTAKNINVYCDDDLISVLGKDILTYHVKSSFDDVEYYDIDISGITLNGVPAELIPCDAR